MRNTAIFYLLTTSLVLSGCATTVETTDEYLAPANEAVTDGNWNNRTEYQHYEAKKEQKKTDQNHAEQQERKESQNKQTNTETTRKKLYPTKPPMYSATPSPTVSNWQPNEGHLMRGKELIKGLQRALGRQATAEEMQKRLQSHMGISSTQAMIILHKLGFS